MTDAAAAAPGGGTRWTKTLELGYTGGGEGGGGKEGGGTSGGSSAGSSSELGNPVCFKCAKPLAPAAPPAPAPACKSEPTTTTLPKVSRCSRCKVAPYCSRDCQVSDWKSGTGGGHKHHCASYRRVGTEFALRTDDDKAAARDEVLRRVRFYAFPYAVHRSSTLGRGFLFVQSGCTLAELSLPNPKRPDGRPLGRERSVLMHFLTMGEYDLEVCRDDFEMASVRGELKDAVKAYDERKEAAVLVRFRCGHVAVGLATLVPEYGVCKALGREYYQGTVGAEGSVQLNLDDM